MNLSNFTFNTTSGIRFGSGTSKTSAEEISQKLGSNPSSLEYGVSITDACVGWSKTAEILKWADSQLNG